MNKSENAVKVKNNKINENGCREIVNTSQNTVFIHNLHKGAIYTHVKHKVIILTQIIIYIVTCNKLCEIVDIVNKYKN